MKYPFVYSPSHFVVWSRMAREGLLNVEDQLVRRSEVRRWLKDNGIDPKDMINQVKRLISTLYQIDELDRRAVSSYNDKGEEDGQANQ